MATNHVSSFKDSSVRLQAAAAAADSRGQDGDQNVVGLAMSLEGGVGNTRDQPRSSLRRLSSGNNTAAVEGRGETRTAMGRVESAGRGSNVGFGNNRSSTGLRQQAVNVAVLDRMLEESPKDLVSCASVEVVSEGGTIRGSADICLHPVEHADALLSAQEAKGPRHGISAFHDACKGGRRHVLMLPVNAIVKGLNQVSINDPMLEGWMGVGPAELARYMLWSGYDTLLLQQVPVMQTTSGLGRWKSLETFTKGFAKAWEDEISILLGYTTEISEAHQGEARVGPSTPGSRGSIGSIGSMDSRFHGEEVTRQFGTSQVRPETTTTMNPMMNLMKGLAGAGLDSPVTKDHPGFWPAYVRVHTANVLVENGDAFVHHAFTSRDVEAPWWFSIKGIVMRNRHLDVKGLFSHSYASDVYKSRTQIVTFIENYVEDDNADDLEKTMKEKKSLWGLAGLTSSDPGRGRRLAMFAIEEVDATVNIDPIDPPAAFRRVAVGEEFTEADSLLPRPFSSVDIGHFLTLMQTKSIPALVCFSLPPALKDLRVFREKQEPVSMVQYLSNPVFAEFEPNMPRVAEESGSSRLRSKVVVGRSVSAVNSAAARSARGKGIRWADQEAPDNRKSEVLDALSCPNLDAFLDEVTNERKKTGAVEWSADGEEEADWIAAVVEQLRIAKKRAAAIAKAKKAREEAREARKNGGMGCIDEVEQGGEGAGDGAWTEVPEWVTQQLPDLLRLLEACRMLSNDPTLLQTMVDVSNRTATRKSKGETTTPGATPNRGGGNTPNRTPSRTPRTPNRSRHTTPTSGMRTPSGRDTEEEEEPLMRTFEEEPLSLHWTDVEKLGKSDTLHDTEDGPELLEDQLLSSYLEYSVGQPRLGTRSSPLAEEIVLSNAQFLIDSGSLDYIQMDTSKCGPVKSDLFKSILAKFSALAIMLSQSARKGAKEKGGSGDNKESKDIKAAVHALMCWLTVDEVYECMAGVAVGGGADPPLVSGSGPPNRSVITVYVVERQVLTYTGAAEAEEHYAFHGVYRKTNKGLSIYLTKEHKNQAAGVLWCYLRAKGVPVMVCHLAECLMDRVLDCRWDDANATEEMFKAAGTRAGVVHLGYVGELRPLKFLSETCQDDIEQMPILERACLLRMLAHAHGCIAEYCSGGPSKAKSRSELAASFRIVSTWRMLVVSNLRNMESSRYLNKFEDHLRLPRLTIVGEVIGHRGVDPRRMLWWTWLAVPWSPSARAAVTNLLTVISRAPAPRTQPASAADKGFKRQLSLAPQSSTPAGGAALIGQATHGGVWKMISDLLVTRLGTCMLVRSLVLENRDESPYPPLEKHYHMVALELRGADKTAVFDYLRTDTGMLGEVLNRLVREDCLAADHSAAFLDSKSLGTLHNVKHGKSGNTPTWLETGIGGRLTRFRKSLTAPKDSPVLHGYSVGMYYSTPVLIELLLQITSGSSRSIYTNSALGEGDVNFESVVPMALLHSLVIFGGLSLGAAKISSVNFFSFMVIKLVLAQIQFVAVLIVASLVLLPFISGAAVLLWWHELKLAATFVGVFFFVGIYIMLVSLMLSTTGGKPWSSNSGRCLLLAHAFLVVSPVLTQAGVLPDAWGGPSFLAGVGMLLITLSVGFVTNLRRLYNMTLSSQTLTLSAEEWDKWKEQHKHNADPTALFYKRASSWFMALGNRLTMKRRFCMLDSDLEHYILGFDAIRSAQAVPSQWSAEWDKRLVRGHEALMSVNRGAGVETASTMWAVVKWDVIYGASYFLMVFSDNLVSIWTDKQIVESDRVNLLALALFIMATAGLESMMMLNLGRANGWRFWRMDPEVLSMSDASKSVGNALHRLYLWDMATYTCFVMLCTLGVWCLGYFWIIADYVWDLRSILRATSLVVGYLGILCGLFHKILFGGSISRQKAAVKVSTAALIMGYGLGLGLVAANRYVNFSDKPLAFATIGFTGFFYGFFSVWIYRGFRVQLTSEGFASGQLLSTPSLGTAGQRNLGVQTLHLDGMEARAVESCRSANGGRVLTTQENQNLIRRTLFGSNADPSSLWTNAPRCLRTAFGNKVPSSEDFFRWTISPVPDRCLMDHGFNALVDPERDNLLYVAESIYADRLSFMECLMHETYEWAYGSHQVGVLAELLRDPLPSRMRRQIAQERSRLPSLVDRTLPCTVDAISLGCLKNEIYWRDLSPHAREVVLRMILTQPPCYFRHVSTDASDDTEQMGFIIDDEYGNPTANVQPYPGAPPGVLDPQSDLALAIRLGCRTGSVLVASMEEASLGIEPNIVVARASILSGLSQCVMRFALAHMLTKASGSDPGALQRQDLSVSHLDGRQRVWGAMTRNKLGRIGKEYGRLSNVESILGEVTTLFPPRGAFHLDYLLFGAASGCMGFDREAFALMLDQNPWSLPIFIKLHRASLWLNQKLLHHLVLKTDVLISDLVRSIKETEEGGPEGPIGAGGDGGQDPETGHWLSTQRRLLERMIREQDLPIAFSQWIDQMLLRREPLLADYWAVRDAGNFAEALVSLKLVQDDLAEAFKTGHVAGLSTYADLATFARCGSTIGMMRANRDYDERGVGRGNTGGTLARNIKAGGGVCVIAMDSGTWPLYGGGVSVCRKQLLDDTVGRVRWNTLFEVALPAPLPTTVETPKNIRQIMPVPLWSQNAGGAYENFLSHTSFITRSQRELRTTFAAINAFFIPQLKTLIDLANTPGDAVSVGGMEVAATAIAELYAYFQVFDWETTWKAGTTHDHWAASWLACSARDKQASPLLNSERPNLAELHEILNYWQTLLTCLQVQLPEMNEENRGVIHVSHHGTQALVGIAARRLSGWGLVVWDHGMLWRERCKAIAELHSSSLFVRKSLISLHRLVAKVTLYEADTLTPCTQMNKPWEMRCVSERDSEVRDVVSRKVNPVLNGAPASIQPNNFQPGLNADNKNEWVTVVMLSHVYALKGVLTAIQAADTIVHRYGLKKFRLLVYGSTTHDVVYCRRCQDAIERLKLTENVWLKGKGRPAAVLAQGDLFLNSSVSEGLPLAIIEASRAGLVVVATDVGGTRDVVSEFGGICMPNSPVPLAKTILETLAACKKWCKIGGAPNLEWKDIDLSPKPAETLEKAIFNEDVINARHDWGTRYLEWTSKAFTLDRYRDEHVRALWFADRQAMANCARMSLGWGADPAQKRLVTSYLRLSRLLDVSDRKEHTNLSFISNLNEVRDRIRAEQKSRAPIEISTDPTQLSQYLKYQDIAWELPLLQWLHGGKPGYSDYGLSETSSIGPASPGAQSALSSNMGSVLRPIDESMLEEQETSAGGAGFSPRVRRADVDTKGRGRERPKRLESGVSFADGSAPGEVVDQDRNERQQPSSGGTWGQPGKGSNGPAQDDLAYSSSGGGTSVGGDEASIINGDQEQWRTQDRFAGADATSLDESSLGGSRGRDFPQSASLTLEQMVSDALVDGDSYGNTERRGHPAGRGVAQGRGGRREFVDQGAGAHVHSFDGSESPAASRVMSPPSPVSSGVSSVTPNRGMSPASIHGKEGVGFGESGGGGGRARSHVSSVSRPSPAAISGQQLGNDGGGRGGGGGGYGLPNAPAAKNSSRNGSLSSSPIAIMASGMSAKASGDGIEGRGFRRIDSAGPADERGHGGTDAQRRQGQGQLQRDQSGFDEAAFAEQEKRMRQAFTERMGSMEVGDSTVATGGGGGGGGDDGGGRRECGNPLPPSPSMLQFYDQAGSSDASSSGLDSNTVGNTMSISNASLLQRVGDRQGRSRSRSSKTRLSAEEAAEQQGPWPQSGPSSEVMGELRAGAQHSAFSKMISPAPRVQASPEDAAGQSVVSPMWFNSKSSPVTQSKQATPGRSRPGRRYAGGSTPPEMELPTPSAGGQQDSLAMQGAAERGVKKFGPSSATPDQPPKAPQAGRRPMLQAAESFAADDSADEESDSMSYVSGASSYYLR